jgi:hypothetical protein
MEQGGQEEVVAEEIKELHQYQERPIQVVVVEVVDLEEVMVEAD